MKCEKDRFYSGVGKMAIVGAITGLLTLGYLENVKAAVLTDETITDAVETELLHDPAVWSNRIYVSGKNGIVTLDGISDNLLEKERSARIAQTVKGVRSVVNNVKVRPAKLKTALSLKKDVIDGLATDPATDSYEISVAADQSGKVTLTGIVDSWQEKELAGIVAKGTVGVTALDNRISVKLLDGVDRAEAEIKADIEQRLFWDVLVDGGLIDVAVNGRTVTLTGTVGSASERYRARYLSYVTGVSKVDAEALRVQDWAKDPKRRNPEYVVKSDEDVAKAIRDAFLYDPRVKVFNVSVHVTNGRVTLRGDVDNLAAKRAAEQDARNTVGVLHVINRIKVKPKPGISDADLAKRARSAFLRDPYVDDYEISVVVNNGIAKLYGTVDSYLEKSQAEYVAERVKGIAWVVNNLVVRKDHVPLVYDPYLSYYPPYLYDWYNYKPVGTYATDREIRENIKSELWWSPFVDSDDVAVTVVSGQATLTGEVDSWAEWRAASENAWEGGATWVVNKLEVSSDERT